MNPKQKPVAITIPDDEWEEWGEEHDPRHRLGAQITINGTAMHLEAWAVHYDQNEGQVSDEYSDSFGDLYSGFGADGPFLETTIRGRQYVLFASPHCD